MNKKAGIYIRKMDKKEHKFLGFTDDKNERRKGKTHVGRVVVENEFVNLFRSSGGYYIANLDGEMIYTKVAILSVVKLGKEIFFAISTEELEEQYIKKVVA